MNIFKKTLLRVILLVFICCITFSTISAKAARVVVIEDPNPDGVSVLSSMNLNYEIYIDEDTGYGYVISIEDGQEEILGTCSIIVISRDNLTSYVLCIDDSSEISYGSMIIEFINEMETTGRVISTTGELENIFDKNNKVTIVR